MDVLAGKLQFIKNTEPLKDVQRSAYTATGKTESTAEHSWRLCLLAMTLEDQLSELDFTKLLKMCVLHDLGETISGDIPAIHQNPQIDKSDQERRDLHTLMAPLDEVTRSRFMALWEEYNQATSPEAVAAKGLDKLETLMQHNQGQNPEQFDYQFNLDYGRRFTDAHPVLRQLRSWIDEETQANARQSANTPAGD